MVAASRSYLNAQFFKTRGVVLTPEDLTLEDWPERAKRAGLTTIALHPFPGKVIAFINSEAGGRFIERCKALGLQVEYELHAMAELLPRSLFAKDPGFFRMNDDGSRTPDANLCVHSKDALRIAAQNAVEIAKVLRPTTGRYYYWGDDGLPWCRCPECRGLSDSDQALLLELRLLDALRAGDPSAQLAHLAYVNTLEPPRRVAPHPGIFLEFAPINRRYDVPLADPASALNRRHLEFLEANLALFTPDTAQVLEYWLDCSRFSKWKRPAVRIPWSSAVFGADLDAYGSRGIRNITTFAVYIDADYIKAFGDPPLNDYGAILSSWPRQPGSSGE